VQISDGGLVFEKVLSDLPWQDVVFFRKSPAVKK
jgi:hypothetical protein